jgi:hypothetical protein
LLVLAIWFLSWAALVFWARSFFVADFCTFAYSPLTAAEKPNSGLYVNALLRSGQFAFTCGLDSRLLSGAPREGISFDAGEKRPPPGAWYGHDQSIAHRLGFFSGARGWVYSLFVPGWALAMVLAVSAIVVNRVRRFSSRRQGRDLYYHILRSLPKA